MSSLTQAAVKREFSYIRSILRDAEKSMSKDFNNDRQREQLGSELIAAASVFSEWVSQQK